MTDKRQSVDSAASPRPTATEYITEDDEERRGHVYPTDVKLRHVDLVSEEQLDALCSFLVNMSVSRFFTSSHAVVDSHPIAFYFAV